MGDSPSRPYGCFLFNIHLPGRSGRAPGMTLLTPADEEPVVFLFGLPARGKLNRDQQNGDDAREEDPVEGARAPDGDKVRTECGDYAKIEQVSTDQGSEAA